MKMSIRVSPIRRYGRGTIGIVPKEDRVLLGRKI